MPEDPLELAIYLHKTFTVDRCEERIVYSTVPEGIDFDPIKDALSKTGLEYAGTSPKRRVIAYCLPSGFFLSLQEMLGAVSNRVSTPSRFYLLDIDFLYSKDTADELPMPIKRYLSATSLFDLLSRVADHVIEIGSDKKLIFLCSSKKEITPQYSIHDLIELPNIECFKNDFIETKQHTEQKKTILKSTINDLFSGISSIPFSLVIAKFSDLYKAINENYNLYVSEFSFNKVKAEIERERLDATIKLNKAFSDIQNQLLAIPAAIIVAGGQMVESNGFDSKNLILWLGVFVFSIFMALLIRNQKNTLTAIDHEIKLQWDQLKSKYSAIAPTFSETYSNLNIRYKHQCKLIFVIDFLVSVALASTTYLFLLYTVPDEANKITLYFSVSWLVLIMVYLLMAKIKGGLLKNQ
ncbi:hypothetical protein [Aeromonas caviae]|uniref:hypothetical protein n=1 Tax=Aeromonas caviae TaxID=648 RepID=UPI002B4A550B|nr:hypothetical protein [Aeromonas caviae]